LKLFIHLLGAYSNTVDLQYTFEYVGDLKFLSLFLLLFLS
jgi:hypothetical protein